MQAGRLAKARRGELAIPLPVGYVRRASGEAALDPDEQVQTVVRLVFGKFAELGTLHGVLRWLVDHGIQLGIRLRSGPDTGELVWRRPNRMTLQCMLHNPVYAGIYAYGRRRVDPRRQLPGRPAPAGWCAPRRNGWCCCPGGYPPTSASSSTTPTWPAWPPTPPAPRHPGLPGPGRRCCPAWRAAAAAADA
jgi:recombinase